MKFIKFIILFSVIFSNCKKANKKISFLPFKSETTDGIYKPDFIYTDKKSKTIDIQAFQLPNIVGSPLNFDFKTSDKSEVIKEYLNSTEKLMKKSPYIFTSTKITKLTYKNSYIYVGLPYEAGTSKKYSPLVTGIVKDSEVILQNNLRINMNKESSLSIIFNSSFLKENREFINYADTLILNDHWSIMQHRIIYKDNKLISIEMEYLPEKMYQELLKNK